LREPAAHPVPGAVDGAKPFYNILGGRDSSTIGDRRGVTRAKSIVVAGTAFNPGSIR
jgi:hypothetical protein